MLTSREFIDYVCGNDYRAIPSFGYNDLLDLMGVCQVRFASKWNPVLKIRYCGYIRAKDARSMLLALGLSARVR